MKNLDIASMFYAIADILELQNVQWKPAAYRRAARSIESLSKDIEDVYAASGLKGLMEIPGVGEGLAKKIEEYIQTGKIKEYEKLKASLPKGLSELIEVPGMGPKKAMLLFNKLKIQNLSDLEKAAKLHKIAALKGFGKKSEENILRGIDIFRKGRERMLLGVALPMSEEIIARLNKVNGVDHIAAAGSLRRRKETIGDIDILVTTEDAPATKRVMDAFTTMPDVIDILAKGTTKSAVLLRGNIQTDIRVLKDEEFGSALQYFTGNKEHNIEMRKIAIKKGMKLSEYGLFKGKKRIAGHDEEGIYTALGLKIMPPEMRENTGEIEASLKGTLPKVVDYKDILGDFHVHTNHSDGEETVEEMATAAFQKGYSYLCISDHSKSEVIAGGMKEDELIDELKEIKALNSKFSKAKKKFRLFSGCEVDIKGNGELDFDDDILKRIEIVTCSVHSGFKSPKEKMTERILAAMGNKYMKILAHPTGRIINARPPYEVDLDKVFEKAADKKIAIEINASPGRLDLNDANIRKAISYGVKLAIGTDSHNWEQLRFMDLGVAMARRGWAEKKDILNTHSTEEVMKFFKIRE